MRLRQLSLITLAVCALFGSVIAAGQGAPAYLTVSVITVAGISIVYLTRKGVRR